MILFFFTKRTSGRNHSLATSDAPISVIRALVQTAKHPQTHGALLLIRFDVSVYFQEHQMIVQRLEHYNTDTETAFQKRKKLAKKGA